MIHVACPACGKRFKVDDRYAGQTGICKNCGAKLPIPTPTPPTPPTPPPGVIASAITAPPKPGLPATSPASGGSAQDPAPLAAPLPVADPSSSAATPAHQHPASARTHGAAVASLVLGILGFITGCVGIGVILAIVGIVLGIVALVQIAKPHSQRTGRGIAIAGIITSSLALLVVPALLIAILLPAFGAARNAAHGMVAQTNLRQLAVNLSIYASNHNDHTPPDLDLLAATGYVNRNVFFHPARPKPWPAPARSTPPGTPADHVPYRYGDLIVLLGTIDQSDLQSPTDLAVAYYVWSPGVGTPRPILYVDGHTDTQPPMSLSTFIAQQNHVRANESKLRLPPLNEQELLSLEQANPIP